MFYLKYLNLILKLVLLCIGMYVLQMLTNAKRYSDIQIIKKTLLNSNIYNQVKTILLF